MVRLEIVNAILFGVCAVLWLLNGIREQDVFDYFLSVVWLTGAVVWVARSFKENKKEK